MDTNEQLAQLEAAIERGDEVAAPELARLLLAAEVAPEEITAALSRAMARLGESFHRLDIFVPDLLIAADAFAAVMAVLAPVLQSSPRAPKGTVVIGVVEGDIHTLGKNLVRVMLAADGFTVHDLGRDVKAAEFVDAAVARSANLIALSSLMTTTMERMRDVLDLLESRGLRDQVRVLVGGAPVTQTFAEEIGADGYGEDASGAVAAANALLAAARGSKADRS